MNPPPPLLAAMTAAANVGWASCGLFALTLLFMLGCVFLARTAKGWDKFGYVAVAVIGSWIGCGVGAVVGLVGLALGESADGPALLGVGSNLLLGGGPWFVFQLRKHRGARGRTSQYAGGPRRVGVSSVVIPRRAR